MNIIDPAFARLEAARAGDTVTVPEWWTPPGAGLGSCLRPGDVFTNDGSGEPLTWRLDDSGATREGLRWWVSGVLAGRLGLDLDGAPAEDGSVYAAGHEPAAAGDLLTVDALRSCDRGSIVTVPEGWTVPDDSAGKREWLEVDTVLEPGMTLVHDGTTGAIPWEVRDRNGSEIDWASAVDVEALRLPASALRRVTITDAVPERTGVIAGNFDDAAFGGDAPAEAPAPDAVDPERVKTVRVDVGPRTSAFGSTFSSAAQALRLASAAQALREGPPARIGTVSADGVALDPVDDDEGDTCDPVTGGLTAEQEQRVSALEVAREVLEARSVPQSTGLAATFGAAPAPVDPFDMITIAEFILGGTDAGDAGTTEENEPA